jgi:hypothetical protein
MKEEHIKESMAIFENKHQKGKDQVQALPPYNLIKGMVDERFKWMLDKKKRWYV